MFTIVRWTVGVAGLLFVVSGFIPFTPALHIWTVSVLGIIVGGFGFAAMRSTAWGGGVLLGLAGLWMVVSGFVGGVQTGPGHVWSSVLTGLVVLGLLPFVHAPEATRV